MLKNRIPLVLLWPLLALVPLIVLVRYTWAIITNPTRAWRIAVGFDQLGNVAANGHEDETISSRAARARDNNRRWGCVLCKLLDTIDPDHCNKSKGV